MPNYQLIPMVSHEGFISAILEDKRFRKGGSYKISTSEKSRKNKNVVPEYKQ